MSKEKYISPKDITSLYGVSSQGLRKWSIEGKIKYIRTPGGHRRYNIVDVGNIIKGETDNVIQLRTGIIYTRVSSGKQKNAGDLDRQTTYLRAKYPNHTVISDVGSGVSYSRRGLLSLFQQVLSGNVYEVVIASKDRLCRFAFDLVEWWFLAHNTKITIVDKENCPDTGSPTELVEDLIAITTVFISRCHGKRRYKNKIKTDEITSHNASQKTVKQT